MDSQCAGDVAMQYSVRLAQNPERWEQHLLAWGGNARQSGLLLAVVGRYFTQAIVGTGTLNTRGGKFEKRAERGRRGRPRATAAASLSLSLIHSPAAGGPGPLGSTPAPTSRPTSVPGVGCRRGRDRARST